MTDCGGFDFFLFANYNNSRVPEANNVEISKGLKTVSNKFYSFGRIYDEGKHLNNHFAIIGLWEISKNMLQWWTRSFEFHTTKKQHQFQNTWHVKNTHFHWKTSKLWDENTLMPFFSPTLEHRRPQTCLLRPLRVPSKYLKEDKVMPAAPTLSLKLLISKKKRLLSYMESDWPFVSFLRGWEASLLVKLGSTSDLMVNLNSKNELKNQSSFWKQPF